MKKENKNQKNGKRNEKKEKRNSLSLRGSIFVGVNIPTQQDKKFNVFSILVTLKKCRNTIFAPTYLSTLKRQTKRRLAQPSSPI